MRDAPNPALYTLNAIAIQTPWTLLWNHLAGVHELDVPLWSQALASLSEFFQVLIWTLPLHGAVYLLGGGRPLRTTYGVILYVTAGPLTMMALLLMPLLAYGANGIDAHHITPKVVGLALATLLATLVVVLVWAAYVAIAVAGAHRLKLGRVVAATSFILISALVFMGWFGRHHPAIGHALGMSR
jgi:hypothetical protein